MGKSRKKLSKMQIGGLSIAAIIVLGLSIIQIIGLIYLTKFAFAKPRNSAQCLTVNTAQNTIVKITVILLWISFVFHPGELFLEYVSKRV